MTKIESLKKEIESLSPQELRAFRRWLSDFDARLWDRKLERDVTAGKLDRLVDEPSTAHEQGEGRKL